MSETTVVDARLDKIERDNRRLKLTVGALLLVLAGAACAGAMMPQEIPSVIQAREFQTVDGNGDPRAVMNFNGIQYRDENGTIRATMTTNGIGYHDENGNLRAGMTADAIAYADENENLRAFMTDEGIAYWDENGNTVWSTACAPNC